MTLPAPETLHLYASGKYQPPTRDDIMAVFGKRGMKEAQIADQARTLRGKPPAWLAGGLCLQTTTNGDVT